MLADVVDLSPSFSEHFANNVPGWYEFYLRVFGGYAVGYLLVAIPLVAIVFAVRGNASFSSVARCVSAFFLPALLFIPALLMFEVIVLYLRYVPFGSGIERQGESRDDFFAGAQAGLLALYALLVLVAALLGRWVGRSWWASAAATVGTLLYFAVSFEDVEYVNACHIGKPAFLREYIACG